MAEKPTPKTKRSAPTKTKKPSVTKTAPAKTSKLKSLKTFVLSCMAIILILIAGTIGYYAAANYRVEHRLSKEYNTVVWPSTLQPEFKRYDGYSFRDWTRASTTQPYVYAYGYKVAPGYTMQQVQDQMSASLQKAGYTLTKYTYPTPISWAATHGKFTVYVTIMAREDSADLNDPNAIADKVGVSIDEHR